MVEFQTPELRGKRGLSGRASDSGVKGRAGAQW